MKKLLIGIIVVLLIILIIIIILLCKKSSSSSIEKTNKMTCTYYEKADNEYESSIDSKEEFIYDRNNYLIAINSKIEYEYSSKELADKYRSVEEKSMNNANNYSGVVVKVDTITDTKFIVNHHYDVQNIDLDLIFGLSDYLDNNKKFSVEKYKSYYESYHQSRNGKCTISKF